MRTGNSFTEGIAAEGKIDHQPPSSAEVMNEWIHTSIPPVILHGLDKDKFYCFFSHCVFLSFHSALYNIESLIKLQKMHIKASRYLSVICKIFLTSKHCNPAATGVDNSDILRINWNSSLINTTVWPITAQCRSPRVECVSVPACPPVDIIKLSWALAKYSKWIYLAIYDFMLMRLKQIQPANIQKTPYICVLAEKAVLVIPFMCYGNEVFNVFHIIVH
jgi:hypothetical protein